MNTEASSALSLVVLAAGMGRRFGGLKQLEGFGPHGERLLEYSVYDAMRAGFTRVIFVIRPEMETAFNAVFGVRFARRMSVAYAWQTPDHLPEETAQAYPTRSKPWGTGHAVWTARALLDAPFAVINADDLYGPTAFTSIATFLRGVSDTPNHYALVAFSLGQTLSEAGNVSRGVCRCDAQGQLLDIVEMPRIRRNGSEIVAELESGETRILMPTSPVSMNLWGFVPGFLPMLESAFTTFLAEHGHHPDREFYLPQAVSDLVTAGAVRVDVMHSTDPWMGVTYPEDRPAVRQALATQVRRGRYPSPLWP